MRKDTKVYCNCCGKEICRKNEIYTEEFIHLKKDWGYFSENDGLSQEADICEQCLIKWMKTFKYAPDSWERTEI